MSLGKVEIIAMNLANGALPEVERTMCFVGAGKNEVTHGKLFPITPSTDLAALFGDESVLAINLTAAIQNANTPNFFAYAVSVPNLSTYKDILMPLFDAPTDLDVEAIVYCDPITSKTDIEAAEAFIADVTSKYSKFISIFLTTKMIDDSKQTWADFCASLKAITTGVACPHVSIVPNLHGNNLGVVSGRLCNPAVTIGDSPMRVATGALVGLMEAPLDNAGKTLEASHIIDLSNARFSVPQWFPSYPGIYWGDMMMLDAPGGDFQVYEYLRCVQAAMRRVYILAVKKVADRTLNSTKSSIAKHETYFERPLRDMSKGVIIAGIEFPGAIQPPKAGDVSIQWVNLTTVNIALLIAPVACPKKITCYLALDLNRL